VVWLEASLPETSPYKGLPLFANFINKACAAFLLIHATLLNLREQAAVVVCYSRKNPGKARISTSEYAGGPSPEVMVFSHNK
jgi:hypothetical protein